MRHVVGAVRLELGDELTASDGGERAAHTDVLEYAVVAVQTQHQRANRGAFG